MSNIHSTTTGNPQKTYTAAGISINTEDYLQTRLNLNEIYNITGVNASVMGISCRANDLAWTISENFIHNLISEDNICYGVFTYISPPDDACNYQISGNTVTNIKATQNSSYGMSLSMLYQEESRESPTLSVNNNIVSEITALEDDYRGKYGIHGVFSATTEKVSIVGNTLAADPLDLEFYGTGSCVDLTKNTAESISVTNLEANPLKCKVYSQNNSPLPILINVRTIDSPCP